MHSSKPDLILKATMKLFSEKGYHDTKIIDIAVEAGVGKGTVYEYFPTKEDLFAEAIRLKTTEYHEQMNELIDEAVSCEENLKRYFIFESNFIKEHSGMRAFADVTMDPSLFMSEKISSILSELFEAKFLFISSIIHSGVKSGEFKDIDITLATIIFVGAIKDFTMIKYKLHPACHYDVFPNVLAEDEFFAVLLNYLRK